MSKTNWTKVESALAAGLEKMKKEELLRQADAARVPERPQAQPSALASSRLQLQLSLKHLVGWLWKENKKLCEVLKITKPELTRLITKPKELSEQDWQAVQTLYDQCLQLKKALQATGTSASDESLIQAEKKKHVYKRYSVNDKWLPLK